MEALDRYVNLRLGLDLSLSACLDWIYSYTPRLRWNGEILLGCTSRIVKIHTHFHLVVRLRVDIAHEKANCRIPPIHNFTEASKNLTEHE
jgi:hypothetical protein